MLDKIIETSFILCFLFLVPTLFPKSYKPPIWIASIVILPAIFGAFVLFFSLLFRIWGRQ